jgi:Ca2+-transporting ATPase
MEVTTMTEQKKIATPQGLTTAQAKELGEQFGKNELTPEKKESFFHKGLDVLSEPMFLLLIIAAIVYFVLGEPRDGSIMLVFVLGIILTSKMKLFWSYITLA